MLLTSAEELRLAIGEILDNSGVSQTILIAVAFWGEGAETLLPIGRHYRVICNLSKGGTDPATIRKLMMYAEVKQSSSLHAKVLVGQNGCLIGSANFSNSAIGFRGAPLLQEADVVLPRSDERFGEIRDWFWRQWEGALPIFEHDLRNAERHWKLRSKFFDEIADRSGAADEAIRSKYVLKEEDLFAKEITGNNKIRMASKLVESLFQKLESQIDKTIIRIPAFVSSILWTYYGRSIPTKIPDRQEFQLPAHVWERALEPGQPAYNESKIHEFLSLLSEGVDVPPAISYWAKKYIEDGCPGAP